ncbi:MAG: Glycosyl phosphatidyl inositol protein transamidase complex subunit [Caeruleum heppii]|nr:MAG: Glycosyl phosphatidyl inositol protein transamidase complex subunit [Caeruleum heppii]
MSVISAILSLRRDPRILKLPPLLSALCIIIGILWLLLLPLQDYSRRTYISENALLPGQVHTYFGGSEHNVWQAYKHEVEDLSEQNTTTVVAKLADLFQSAGLKVARQKYDYITSGQRHVGENVYGILHAPRGDATEAIVLVAAWRNIDDALNQSGVSLVLALARYFKRWSLWSKDIIFVITGDSKAGPQAWVDAYHDSHDPASVASLPLKSGALQGAVVVDYAFSHRFDTLHIVYDGINGQLPNLDLFNTAVAIAEGQMGINVALQRMWRHSDSYRDRLQTMLRGMMNQGLGHASGPHSSFIPYHVDAITLQAVGDGWHDEMTMGRSVESIFRSLNNLLEQFHQSFFFYLLMQSNRFVSIGTYLPSAMLVAINFTIIAIASWVQSGRPPPSKIASTFRPRSTKEEVEVVEGDGATAIVPTQTMATVEREMFLPLSIVIGVHFLGVVPLYIFNQSSASTMNDIFTIFAYANLFLPYVLSFVLTYQFPPTEQQYLLIRSFSLLLLGMILSALATLNFSLALLVGLLSAPLSYVRPLPEHRALAMVAGFLLHLMGPSAVLAGTCWYWDTTAGDVLVEAAFGWHVSGMWTQVVIWCVWWPAWLIGSVLLACSVDPPADETSRNLTRLERSSDRQESKKSI